MVDNRKAITIEARRPCEWIAVESWDSLELATRRVETITVLTGRLHRLVWTDTGEPLP